MDDLDWKKPALIGGLIAGILSVVPLINMLNTCLCLWAWVGGIVAAKLLIDRSPRIVTSKDGARIGLFSGLIAGAIVLLISMPLMLWQMNRTLQSMPSIFSSTPEAQELLERIQNDSTFKILFSFVSSFITSVLILGFTVLGGVLGVALFEKRKNQPPPPYPPPYPPQYPPQYPPNYPQQPAPSTDYPPPPPPQSGGSGGDQGGGQSGQGGQGSWPKE
jgi:hypothetical protein